MAGNVLQILTSSNDSNAWLCCAHVNRLDFWCPTVEMALSNPSVIPLDHDVLLVASSLHWQGLSPIVDLQMPGV